MFKGSFTALISPFRNGALDETSYERIVEWQIAQGTNGLVPVGTTGESPTLSHDEHKRAVEICVETTAKRVPVIEAIVAERPAVRAELLRGRLSDRTDLVEQPANGVARRVRDRRADHVRDGLAQPSAQVGQAVVELLQPLAQRQTPAGAVVVKRHENLLSG